MKQFYLVHVTKNERHLIGSTDELNQIIEFIEDQYVDPIVHLEDVSIDEFKNEATNASDFDNGLYIIEEIDSINVYQVKTLISFGYLYNSAEREIKLKDRYELVVNDE